MSYTPKPGTGSLFKNDKKSADTPQRPDYRGTLTLPDGSTVQLGGWVSEGKTGKYLALKVSDPLPPIAEPAE